MHITPWLILSASLALLSACAGSTAQPDPGTAGGASGVTVYGTADAGVGRVKK